MPRPLENRIAFVTGAASGIGLQIAEDFAAEGARVCVADLNETAAAKYPYQRAFMPLVRRLDGSMHVY